VCDDILFLLEKLREFSLHRHHHHLYKRRERERERELQRIIKQVKKILQQQLEQDLLDVGIGLD